MVLTLAIPEKALPYICMQWPGIPKKMGIKFDDPYQEINKIDFSNSDIQSNIKRIFSGHIESDYSAIKEYIPSEPSRILDIGCGSAGIDAMIHCYNPNQSTEFYLLDKTEVSNNFTYGFSGRKRFYASLPIAKAMLQENGVKADKVHLIEAAEDLPKIHPVDLVLSMHSWGFHYPLQTYIDYVWKVMSDVGTGITDVRESKNDLSLLEERFEIVERIQDHGLRTRVLFKYPRRH